MPWLFLLAYTCSGVAGLVYEVSWTRLLTLYIGHTTAAAAAVVAAFLGGLSAGAAIGGSWAARQSRVGALRAYIALEIGVALVALTFPFVLRACTPLLAAAYGDAGGVLFSITRLAICLALVFLPAAALGATFPMAIRWRARDAAGAAGSSGLLYAVNTFGAAAGALLAGFVLIPAIGVSGTTLTGVVFSLAAAFAVWMVLRQTPADDERIDAPAKSQVATPITAPIVAPPVLVMAVLGISGFAALAHEIAWTRILALMLGPTTYAFAATLAAVIGGVAIGSALGTALVSRVRRPARWLAATLALAALATSYTYSLAGQRIPQMVAQQMATAVDPFTQLIREGLILTAALILPSAVCLGAAFPLALALAGGDVAGAAARFARVYAVNTIGSVLGSLAAGFILIPWLGLQGTLIIVSALLTIAALIVVMARETSTLPRLGGGAIAVLVAALIANSPPWDRELLASGPYMYAPFVPAELDLDTQLKAGEMLYYREGASATVSVKRLTGTTTLAVDGKVDASNRGDMLTQKLIAHLPLLLHERPRDVAIIGLGSGVTVGAALRHPIDRVDVIEISPEVVEASRFFEKENHNALADPRTKLIVGDGRSHLMLTQRMYDVVMSEPSNPWIAGVAALFTREFFEGVRSRLKPGGVFCQWANAYNIAGDDLRAIVGTFLSVFPHGTVWLVGADDVLMVASDESLDARLSGVAEHWSRAGVSDDLAEVGVTDPFSIWSLYAGGPEELGPYAAGTTALTDDTIRLEFSAPRELHQRRAGENDGVLLSLLAAETAEATQAADSADGTRAADGSGKSKGPLAVRRALDNATVAQWAGRGQMMARSDVHTRAYDDFHRALAIDPGDAAALDGFARAAVILDRASQGLDDLAALTSAEPSAATGGGRREAGGGRREAGGGTRDAGGGRREAEDGSITTAPSAPVASVTDRSAPVTIASGGLARIALASSKLLAAAGQSDAAIDAARSAVQLAPAASFPLEQLASLHADANDTVRLDETVAALRRVAPDTAPTFYYAAVAALLHGDAAQAVFHATQATIVDPNYAPVYDLAGAAYTHLGRFDEARTAFERSLSFDGHDSTAYTNLGLLALQDGANDIARGYFAEALWLTPDSKVARDGLARTRR